MTVIKHNTRSAFIYLKVCLILVYKLAVKLAVMAIIYLLTFCNLCQQYLVSYTLQNSKFISSLADKQLKNCRASACACVCVHMYMCVCVCVWERNAYLRGSLAFFSAERARREGLLRQTALRGERAHHLSSRLSFCPHFPLNSRHPLSRWELLLKEEAEEGQSWIFESISKTKANVYLLT